MTVPIIENWADVKGELLDTYPSPAVDGFVTLELKVNDVENVEGFKNPLDDKKGEVIRVNVKEDVIQDMDLKPGARLSCRVRMAGPKKFFAHPECVKIE